MTDRKPLWRWTKGRQDAQYDVLKLFVIKSLLGCGFDGYLIRYIGPVKLPRHVDVVASRRHFRINIVFGTAGEPEYETTIFNWRNRIIIFRPDTTPHAVNLQTGRRYVLSFGAAVP